MSLEKAEIYDLRTELNDLVIQRRPELTVKTEEEKREDMVDKYENLLSKILVFFIRL